VGEGGNGDVSGPSRELRGLHAQVDRLVYHQDPNLPDDRPHAFIYFITIFNHSQVRVHLLGRKWVLRFADGRTQVIEGEGIVGQRPLIAPGKSFSYNSYHVTDMDATATASFHGLDPEGQPIRVSLQAFEMVVPRGEGD
jgi:ApaG protein